MRILMISYTGRGGALADRLTESMLEHDFIRMNSTSELCETAFRDRLPAVFVGAAGIAVRSIAPFVRDKLTDPPVIVIDEAGQFVIPILSGHAGGANELALMIAKAIGASPVITTATDVNNAFAADVFAREQGLRIMNREGIAKVSSSAIEGRTISLSIKDYPPAEDVDVIITDEPSAANKGRLWLSPKKYAVGIGCRRGKPFEKIRDFAEEILSENGIDVRDVGVLASIDLKADEEGLKLLAQYWRVPFITFEAALLEKVSGDFSKSEFVREQVGTDNVCERAAALAAGQDSRLMVRKSAGNGMTVAIAKSR